MVYRWSWNRLATLSACLLALVFLIACGASAQPPADSGAQQAPPAAAASEDSQAKAMPEVKAPQGGEGQSPALMAYADEHAGGPGAIYAGKLEALAGPAPTKDLGDLDGNVSLGALQRHSWLFESDYYRTLLEKARLDNPTPLVTGGQQFTVQYSCVNRALLPCKLLEAYLAPNVRERTNGQVEIQVVGYPELGIAGPDTLQLVGDGTLAISEIYGGYVAGDLPVLELQYLWGLYPDHETEYEAITAVLPELDQMISDATGGALVLLHNWYAGTDQYFFTNKPIRTLEDFQGLKTRSHGTALSDWIEGMGATAQFVAFAEVYTALERGILDAGVTGADPAYGQRWYEVTDYMVGPLVTFQSTNIVVNRNVWDGLPPDIQQVLIEEGARNELEALRLAAAQNEVGVLRNLNEGMELIEFTPEMKEHEFNNVVMERVLPNWVQRAGGPDSAPVRIYNEKVAPLLGVKINPDGTASKIPVAK